MAKVDKVPMAEGREVDYSESGLGREFRKLVASRVDDKAEVKRLEARLEQTNSRIKELMGEKGIKKVTGLDGWQATRAVGTTASKLSAELLLKHGVEADVIEASTLKGRHYEYLLVTEEKDEKETE